MTTCTCGAEASRTIVHFEGPDGKPLPASYTTCQACRPDEFHSLERLELTPNWVANPGEYDTLDFTDTGERVPIIKDWAKGEFENLVAEGPVAKAEEADAIEKKRAFARERNKRGPLTKDEIDFRVNHFRQQFAENDRIMSAEAAGIIIP